MEDKTKKSQGKLIGIIVGGILAVILVVVFVLLAFRKAFERTSSFPLILNPTFNFTLQKYIYAKPVTQIFSVTGCHQSGKTFLLSNLENVLLQNHGLPIPLDFEKAFQANFAETFHLKLASILSSLILTPKQTQQISFLTFPRDSQTKAPHFAYSGLSALYVTLVDAFDAFYHNDILNESETSGLDQFMRILSHYQSLLRPVVLLNNAELLISTAIDPKMMQKKLHNFLSEFSQYALFVPIITEVHNPTLLFESQFSNVFYVSSISPIENPSSVLQKYSLFTKSEAEKLTQSFGGFFYPASHAFSELQFRHTISETISETISDEAPKIEEMVKNLFKDPKNPLWDALCKGPVVVHTVEELRNVQNFIDAGLLSLRKVKGEWELFASCPIVTQQISLLHKKPRSTPKPTTKPKFTPKLSQKSTTKEGAPIHEPEIEVELDLEPETEQKKPVETSGKVDGEEPINQTMNDPNCTPNSTLPLQMDEENQTTKNTTSDLNEIQKGKNLKSGSKEL